jgi:ketosteroid isomerase-like protein
VNGGTLSEANIEVVLRVYEALNARDVEGLIDLTHGSVVAVPPSGLVTGDAGPYRGHADVHRWLEEVTERWESFRAEPAALTDEADLVLADVTVTMKPRRGPAFEREIYAVWRVKDGKVVAVRGYQDRRDALDAFGRR